MLFFRFTVTFLSPGQFFSTKTLGGSHCLLSPHAFAHSRDSPSSSPALFLPLSPFSPSPAPLVLPHRRIQRGAAAPLPLLRAARPEAAQTPPRPLLPPSARWPRLPPHTSATVAGTPSSIPACLLCSARSCGAGGGGPELRRRWWAADPRPARPDPAAGTTATGTQQRRRLPFAPSLSGGASGGGARREARCAGRGGGARHQRRPLPDPVFFGFFCIQILFDVLFLFFHLINFSTVKIFLVIFFMSPIFVS